MAVLSLLIWLFITIAEFHPALHEWLHGGKIPVNDDDCAIVAIAHGKLEAVAIAATVPVPVIWINVTPHIAFTVFVPEQIDLLTDRGPPAVIPLNF